jgi:hypothetical protein
MDLKEEEKLIHKQGQRGRGRSQPRGKTVVQEKYQKPKEGRVERGDTSQKGPDIEQRGQHNE